MKKLPSIPKDSIEDKGFGERDNPFADMGLQLPIPTFRMGRPNLQRRSMLR